MSVIEWENPPPDGRAGRTVRFNHAAIAEQLRTRPGTWGRIVGMNASGWVKPITTATLPAYTPPHSFEAMYRRDRVYARYVGEGSDV